MSNGIKIQYLNGLGLVAKNKRVIRQGALYNKYFPVPEKTDPIVNKDGSVMDTVDYCEKIVRDTLNDTKLLAPTLKRSTVELTCAEIFSFIYDYIQYEEDKPGVEQVRRPARTWADRKGDCDCMSIFASSILTNLGIPHSFRIVKMYGRNWFQHIYVIVPRAGKTDMTKRENYIVIDPVLDHFNEEAPKINFKQDFKMENLSGIPIQYLNGNSHHKNNVNSLGHEFDDFEGLRGTDEQLSAAWHGRMKAHLVNTHRAITNNPKAFAPIYDTQALAGAYKELINNWDSENAREGTLDRLSAKEDSFLKPHLQGLGDIIHDDDRMFGIMNTDLNGQGFGSLGKKSAARKAAKAEKKQTKKKGIFTKIKNASKKVKGAVKKAGAGIKKVGGKVGKSVVKGALTPIRTGLLLAMKVNFGKLGSRMYWGLFSKEEAASHGVLPDYWQAANDLYNKLKKTFINKLKGTESVLRKAILTGRAAKVGKRGTHGLGSLSELYVNGLGQLRGLGEAGGDDIAEILAAAGAILVPLIAVAAKSFKGKKATPSSPPDNGSTDPHDTGDDDTSSNTPDAADNAQDNYNAEVVADPPDQEDEPDGSNSDDDSTDDSVQGFGDVVRKLHARPGSRTHTRIVHDLGKKSAAKVAKKAAKKAKKVTKKATKKAAKVVKKAAKVVKKNNKKVAKTAKHAAVAAAHAANAHANKKLSLSSLVSKIKKTKAFSKLSPAQLIQKAQALKNLTPAEIATNALTFANKTVIADQYGTDQTDATGKEVYKGEDANTPPPDIDPGKGHWERAKTAGTGGFGDDGDDSATDDSSTDTSTDDSSTDTSSASAPTSSNTPASITQNGWVWVPDLEDVVKAVNTATPTAVKIGVPVAIAGAIVLFMMKKGKKKESVSGLSGTNTVKKHNSKMLKETGKSVQKYLAKKGEKMPHGYKIADRKKVRVLKIK